VTIPGKGSGAKDFQSIGRRVAVEDTFLSLNCRRERRDSINGQVHRGHKLAYDFHGIVGQLANALERVKDERTLKPPSFKTPS
jgi:hypothetical protein